MADFPNQRPQGFFPNGDRNGNNRTTGSSSDRKSFNSRRNREYGGLSKQYSHAQPPQASPYSTARSSAIDLSTISFNKRSHSYSGRGISNSLKTKIVKNNLVQVVSETPLIVKVRKYSTIPRSKSLPIQIAGSRNKLETTTRSGRRVQNLKRTNYDFDTDDSDEAEFDDSTIQMHTLDTASGFQPKKRGRPNSKTGNSNATHGIKDASWNTSSKQPQNLDQATNNALISNTNVEGPPSGVIPSLWYSRECCLHIFVIEKILSWKKRHRVSKVISSTTESADPKGALEVNPTEYSKISERVLNHLSSTRKTRKRMDVSRICPSQCPLVLTATSSSSSSDSSPAFKQQYRVTDDTEDVLLIKWRGRSYIHCSWERPADLIRFDPTNNTAKQKIKRFYALQETTLGMNWKTVLEEGRKLETTPSNIETEAKKEDEEEEELAFPPEFTEVERVLACDEGEMDMEIFSNQLKLNLDIEKKLISEREKDKTGTTLGHNLSSGALNSIMLAKEEPWDPEDNVRYVVKWKGMQTSDATWEYWKDLKYDFVNEVADFWYRQRAPSMDVVKKTLVRPHPQVKAFKKLQTSPIFGIKRNAIKQLEPDDDEDRQNALRLRGYQLEGVNWLLWNWFNKRSCILADEMGLGKTIQSVGLLDQLSKLEATKVRGPFMIVAPLSLISQWQSESKAWAPDLNVIVYHGSADARDFMAKQEFYYNEQFVGKGKHMTLKKTNWTKFHVLITTFEVVLKDIAVLSKIRWRCLIVDEAHRLKNPKSRLFLELATVPRDFCLLLTGTPLQNSTEELWALLSFADPIGFASKEAFIEKFGQLTDSKQVRDLHGILKPYLLRRVKEDVEKSLPPKEETILEVSLTPIQKTYYKAIYEKNTSFLFKGSKPGNAPSLMNIMMELRKCCNHPFLIRGAEERILSDAAAAANQAEKMKNESNETPINMFELMAQNLITSSGKMVLLSKLLPKLKDGGHKVLIFSQMVKVLDLLEELLRNKKYRYERLDGSTSASIRSAAVDRFCRKSYQRFVMLLSTRAGGLGLNLTAADTVIIFDSDWNPQNDLQAMARAHRIGQTRAVRVYRLLTAKTYEMHMFHSASMKLGLDRAVLAHQRHNDSQNGENNDNQTSARSKLKKEKEIQAKEIDQLLKKGAYDVFRDEEDDKESKQFMETDIDSLLERSSRKVTYGKTAETSISSGLGSFSKASFVASAGDDIDLDDPDFWKKAVGFEAPPEGANESGMLIDGVEGKKRNRKQVQVFDPYAAFAEAEQRKQDKIIAKAKEEKEEKERLRKAKKLQKQKEKDKRKRERVEAKEAKDKLLALSADQKRQRLDENRFLSNDRKNGKECKYKHMKKNERTKKLRQIMNEDPPLERLKQAWEAPHRNRAVNAALCFGFDRLCKVRQESFLTSVPIQDLEVFLRGYLFQVGLQAAVSFLNRLRSQQQQSDFDGKQASIKMLNELIQKYGDVDGRWICIAMNSALQLHYDIRSRKRKLRLPITLTEPDFLSDLRNGAAVHTLRRLAFLARLTKVIERALDRILLDLGHEELGKRGCSTKDLNTLDVDMKARHVTTEELTHSLGLDFNEDHILGSDLAFYPSLAPWWDRSCDVALLIGSFIHGLGNYKSMQIDEDLPFGFKISQHAVVDKFSFQAFQNFDAAGKAAQKLYRQSMENCHNSVDNEPLVIGKQNQEGDVEKKEISNAHKTINGNQITSPLDKKELNHKKKSSVINLQHLSKVMVERIRKNAQSLEAAIEKTKTNRLMTKAKKNSNKSPANAGNKNSKVSGLSGRDMMLPWNQRLPMPDSLKLDKHLVWLIDCIEKNGFSVKSRRGTQFSKDNKPTIIQSMNKNELSSSCLLNNELIASFMRKLHGEAFIESNRCYDFDSFRCGTKHRALVDESPGASEAIIVDVTDVYEEIHPSKKQSIGVPLVLTKYGVSALVFADESAILELRPRMKVENEKAQPDTVPSEVLYESTASTKVQPDVIPSESVSVEPTASSKVNEYTLESLENLVPSHFQCNVSDRAKICISLLENGSPIFREEKSFFMVHPSAWSALFGDDEVNEDSISDRHFLNTKTLATNCSLSIDVENTSNLDMVESYINSVLLPHCILLCLQGPDLLDESSEEQSKPKSSLPDPYLPINEHSVDSVKIAYSVLRRTRLMKAIRYIMGGGVPGDLLSSFLRSPTVRKNLIGLPIWWCPWIHDLALLTYVATHGLFAIIMDRASYKETFTEHTIFGTDAIELHIRAVFLEGRDGFKPALPQSFLNKATPEEKDAWLKIHASQFPEAHIIERRLAFIASELTTTAAGMDVRNKMAEWRFENFPMFDHANLRCVLNCGDRSGSFKLNKCLHRLVEDEANDETTNT